MWMLMLSLLAGGAFAQDVTSETCGEVWEGYFNAGVNGSDEPTGSALFRAADALGSIGRKKPTEIAVASCSAGSYQASTIVNWGGEYRYDGAGNPVVLGRCTQVDVVEVQGRRQDRCRRFPSSRICQHVDDPGRILIAVGTSRPVTCPEGDVSDDDSDE